MQLSLEVDYAVRIIHHLSTAETAVKAKEITQNCEIPDKFALKILRKLMLSGLIRSFRGRESGYMLEHTPSEISFLNVIEVIEGKLEIHRCHTGGHRLEDSPVKQHCKVSKHMSALNDAVRETLSNLTFDQI